MPREALSIRSFESRDQEMVRRLILDGLGEHFGFVDEALNPDLDDISRHYVAAGALFLVTEHAGEIVGTGALVGRDRDTAQIVRISVSQAQRGKGIGAALVEQLIAAARKGSFSRVLVETNLDWLDAIGLYARCGFIECARDAESVYLVLNLGYDHTAC